MTTIDGLAAAAWLELVGDLETRGVPLVVLDSGRLNRCDERRWSTTLPRADEVLRSIKEGE